MATADGTDTAAPLFLVRGDASAEEVAALTVVVQGLAAGAAAGSEHEQPVGEWAAPHRLVRRTFPSGPGGWRSSALPR